MRRWECNCCHWDRWWTSGARKQQRALVWVAISEIPGDIEAWSAFANAFGGSVAVTPASLTE
jgi:hypothetical protein